MKQSVIFCTQPVRGTLYFYVSSSGEKHYLFGQSYRPSLWNRYRDGIPLDDALDRSKYAIYDQKFREKLLKTLPYIEKEYGVNLLHRSSQSSRPVKRSSRFDRRNDTDLDEIAA